MFFCQSLFVTFLHFIPKLAGPYGFVAQNSQTYYTNGQFYEVQLRLTDR